MKLSPLRGVVIGIALLSLIFITISLSTNYWFVNKNSDTFNGGIWEGCTKIVVSLNVSGVVRTSSGKLDCRKLQVKGKSCSSSLIILFFTRCSYLPKATNQVDRI